jgi:hypothetical protein
VKYTSPFLKRVAGEIGHDLIYGLLRVRRDRKGGRKLNGLVLAEVRRVVVWSILFTSGAAHDL